MVTKLFQPTPPLPISLALFHISRDTACHMKLHNVLILDK
jgi:hypothetical protein